LGHNGGVAQSVSVSTRVAAPPERVYDLVSDVVRMGEWSPETVRCRWLGGATGPAVGARFAGTNSFRRLTWRTECQVTAAERGREFAFEVTGGGFLPVAVWRYELRPVDGGCEVTEHWTDRRGTLLRWYGRLILAVPDRAEHNRRGMEQTLARLKAAAES
jgi:uncharacterized protein YndB with AHSA1/START domain